MNKQVKKADTCPNCGYPLQGENFCPRCGQKNDIRRIRFRHFIWESLSNFFAVDGRFMHTLSVLFTKPGEVPKDYISGKRQRYVHPVRIYFLSSILLLFLIQFSGESNEIVQITETEPSEDSTEVATDAVTPGDSLLLEFAEAPEAVDLEKEDPGRISKMMDYYKEFGETDAAKALNELDLDYSLVNRLLYTQSIKIADFDDQEFSKYFASKLFWVLFLFLPILAALHHLLYLRRKFYYPEHLFFTFYNQAALFLLLALGFSLILITGYEGVIVIFILGFLLYQFIALRRFYGQGTGKTILKFIILNLISIPLFGIFFIIAALITFIFF